MKKYWLALTMIEGLGPVKLSRLLKIFKNPESIWKASSSELKKTGLNNKDSKNLLKQREEIDPEILLNKLKRHKIDYLTLTDSDYPDLLKEIYDPPPVIYYKGRIEIFNEAPAVAMVGSRRSTPYGRKVATRMAYELSKHDIIVVSGLARGIDTAAHQGILNNEGKTAAVLGSGLDYIYPPENRDLFKEIQNDGVVISEFPPGTRPLPGNFPRRNRIISGLCLGVVVVEAPEKSGSLITANLAPEQGREVMAVPGNIDRSRSRGTNDLIKKGAKIVTDVEDILEELFIYNEVQEDKNATIYPHLNEDENKIISIIQDNGEIHINEIIKISGIKAAKVNTLLLKLELKGIIDRGVGKKYSFKGLQNLLKPL